MKTHFLSLSPREFCDATRACSEGVKFALQYDSMREVWDHCPRVDWLCWILNTLDVPADEKTVRLYMVWCARNTPLEDGRTTGALLTDQRSLDALAAAEQFARGEITSEVLGAAESAARSAAWSAAESAAWSAAESAAESAAGSAAESAAGSAAWTVARGAARSAAESAAGSAARGAAWSTAWSAAESAAESAQVNEFRRVVKNPFEG